MACSTCFLIQLRTKDGSTPSGLGLPTSISKENALWSWLEVISITGNLPRYAYWDWIGVPRWPQLMSGWPEETNKHKDYALKENIFTKFTNHSTLTGAVWRHRLSLLLYEFLVCVKDNYHVMTIVLYLNTLWKLIPMCIANFSILWNKKKVKTT